MPDSRVDEVLRIGLTDRGRKRRVKGYSLGMRQRLGLPAALLGNPDLPVLDEPATGSTPEGGARLREISSATLRRRRNGPVSSHVLAEVAQTVDQVFDHQPRPTGHGIVARRFDGPRRRCRARSVLSSLSCRGPHRDGIESSVKQRSRG